MNRGWHGCLGRRHNTTTAHPHGQLCLEETTQNVHSRTTPDLESRSRSCACSGAGDGDRFALLPFGGGTAHSGGAWERWWADNGTLLVEDLSAGLGCEFVPAPCAVDLDSDGVVGTSDVMLILSGLGAARTAPSIWTATRQLGCPMCWPCSANSARPVDSSPVHLKSGPAINRRQRGAELQNLLRAGNLLGDQRTWRVLGRDQKFRAADGRVRFMDWGRGTGAECQDGFKLGVEMPSDVHDHVGCRS